jgi:hypothetical protein
MRTGLAQRSYVPANEVGPGKPDTVPMGKIHTVVARTTEDRLGKAALGSTFDMDQSEHV